jgi:exodeoxyribonuclease VIII
MLQLTQHNYHQDTTRISKSGLDLINKSPRHYWYKNLSGLQSATKEATHFKIGRAFHCSITEPQHFFDRYALAPKVDRRYVDGKEKWAQFLSESEGKNILKTSYDDSEKTLSYDQILRMTGAVLSHPVAAKMFRSGEAEKVITWMDPDTGAPCKSMLDWLTPDGWIVDLKSTTDASPLGFYHAVEKYRYHVQKSMYLDGARANGISVQGFLFVVCEKTAPYNVEVYHLDSEFIQAGRQDYKLNLQTYMECRQTGVWHGYSDFKINKISRL